jgi:hypothetical protein
MVREKIDQPRQDKNLLYRLDEPNGLIKQGPFLDVLLESPFASVSTVSRGRPLSRLSDELLL